MHLQMYNLYIWLHKQKCSIWQKNKINKRQLGSVYTSWESFHIYKEYLEINKKRMNNRLRIWIGNSGKKCKWLISTRFLSDWHLKFSGRAGIIRHLHVLIMEILIMVTFWESYFVNWYLSLNYFLRLRSAYRNLCYKNCLWEICVNVSVCMCTLVYMRVWKSEHKGGSYRRLLQFLNCFQFLLVVVSSMHFNTFLQIHSCEAVNEVKVYESTWEDVSTGQRRQDAEQHWADSCIDKVFIKIKYVLIYL